MKPVRFAVVGAGHMGRLHAAKIAALAEETGELTLVGVADLERARAEEAAFACGARAVADYHELFGEVDAAVVAVPTVVHGEVVAAALDCGLDVLVEKPIAATLEEAEALLARAAARGAAPGRASRVVQRGDAERRRARAARASSRVTAWARSRRGPRTWTWCAT